MSFAGLSKDQKRQTAFDKLPAPVITEPLHSA